MTDDMIASTLERLQEDAQASYDLHQAAKIIMEAAAHVVNADIPDHERRGFLVESCEHLTRDLARQIYERAARRAAQLGWQVATYEIAPMAKGSGDDAVVFITGNSHMPPLRAFGISEDVWQLAESRYWECYVEAIESRLGELRVAMECPDYDNALYVVDLERFEYDDEGDPDTLSGEWKRVSTD